jgi:hypothetical protein
LLGERWSPPTARRWGRGPVSVADGGSGWLSLNGGIVVTNPISLTKESTSAGLQSVSGENTVAAPVTVYQSRIGASSGCVLHLAGGLRGSGFISFNPYGGTVKVETLPFALTNQTIYFGGNSSGKIQLCVAGNVFSSANLWGGATLSLGVDARCRRG